MNRRVLISIHLHIAAFFAAAVILMALSGGLYLLGIKGEVEEVALGSVDGGERLLAAPDRPGVAAILTRVGVEDYDFEYVKVSGMRLYTRPTSRTHYLLEVAGDTIAISRREPDLQARMIELHKGHGPTLFRTFQKVLALGLLVMLLSGVWLGLAAERLRGRTLATALGGLLVFSVLVSL